MSILTTTTRTLPRAAVETWLSAVRLPITAAEAVLGRGKDTSDWPPTLTFATFEATVKQVVGSVLRDEQLLDQGRLEQARVSQLRKAAELDALAETKRQAAEAQYREERTQTAQERQRVREQTEQRTSQIAEKAAAEKAAVTEQAAEAERSVQESQARASERIEREQRAADLKRVRGERAALARKREAAAAQRTVVETDEQIEVAKAVRGAKR